MAVLRSKDIQKETLELKATDIEIAVAKHFGIRRNLIVPNVHWGFEIHECDLLILSPSGYLTEVEIKISKHDLVKDSKKKHDHTDHRIKQFYFAIPGYLYDECKQYIPDKAGILTVIKLKSGRYHVHLEKVPVVNKVASISDYDRYRLARLGALRIWGLKEKLVEASC